MPESADDIIEYVTRLAGEQGFQRRNTAFAEQRRWLYQDAQVDIGTKTQVQYRPYDLADDAHAFKNRMLAAPVKVQIAATGGSARAGLRAQEQENFSRRHYYHWRDLGIFDPVLFDMAAHGAGWVRLFLNPGAIPLFGDYGGKDEDAYLEEAERSLKDFIEKQSADLFMLEHIDPSTVFYSPDKRVRVHAAQVPFLSLQRDYAKKGVAVQMDRGGYSVRTLAAGEELDRPQDAWSEYATVYTYEDDSYCYHVLADPSRAGGPGGHMLGAYRNYFGRPSFRFTYAERTGSGSPAREFAPLLGGKYTIIPLLAQQVTGLLNAGLEAAQMRYTLEKISDMAPPLEGAVTIEMTEDGTLIPPDGYRLATPNLSLGVDVERSIQLIQSLDRFGFPKVLKNPEEVQATSGYDQALQQDAVQSLLTPPLTHFGVMLGELFDMMGHAVKEIGVPVGCQNLYMPDGRRTVGETITLSPANVIDADISVNFNSVTLYNRIAMIETGRILMQADMMTETEFLSDTMGIDDPDAWRDRRSLDKLRKAADDRALADVLLAIDALRGAVMDEAAAENAVGPIVQTNEDALRSDRGASYPTGPGQGQPLAPPPPDGGVQGGGPPLI